jgi:hypothetical protein
MRDFKRKFSTNNKTEFAGPVRKRKCIQKLLGEDKIILISNESLFI